MSDHDTDTGQSPADAAARREGLSPAKRALLRKLAAGRHGETGGVIPVRRVRERAPLSFAQQRLWFLHRLDPADPAYNIPMAFRLDGPLDTGALERSLTGIVRRHEVLRTTFRLEGDSPVQVIGSPFDVRLDTVDISGEGEKGAAAFASGDGGKPFDLERGPLFRARLFRLGEDSHVLVMTVHHIVFDGWSLGVFLSELAQGYAAERGQSHGPEPPAVQFGDYAAWQRERSGGGEPDADIGFWKTALAGSSGVLDIPRDTLPPSGDTRRGGEIRMVLPAALGADLRRLGAGCGATLFMTVASAFGVFLRKLTGAEDLLVGTPVAGRTHSEVERLIGFFVNTVVLRIDMTGDPAFTELLSRVRAATLAALAHQDMPFDRLVEEMRPVRVSGRSPLVQVMVALQNAPSALPPFPGLSVRGVDVPHETAKFDLTLTVMDNPVGLDVSLEYNAAMFARETVGRYASAFRSLLEGIVNDPGSNISRLRLMGPDETREVLARLNPAAAPPPPFVPVHEAVARRVRTCPEARGVSCDGRRMTYAGLNARANRIAGLIPRDASESAVGLCLRRSEEMIPALLGILKAGAAYVPLDPAHPPERLAAMARDARLSLVVTTSDLAGLFPGFRLLCLDTSAEEIARQPAADNHAEADGSRLAYIMFTSGSTGTPKGVCVTHAALAAHIAACSAAYGIGPDDTVLQFASLSFDPSVEQIFTALCSGAHLVVRGEDVWNAGELSERIENDELTIMNLPTAYWHEMGRDLPAGARAHRLRLVIAGGEAMTCGALDAWRRTPYGSVRLLNAYGPTEATVTAFIFDCSGFSTAGLPPSAHVPIGRPLPGRWVCVCDEGGNPLPPGIPGELYIGGTSIARGYVNSPQLTAEKFVRNHIEIRPESLLYRTGDIVRVTPGGEFEFLGRADDQAKVRGYRVEPGEIASLLKQHPSVRDAVVVIRRSASGEAIVTGYVAAGETSEAGLRSFIEQRLPAYMVPRTIVILERLPVLPSGKIDRRALPEPPEDGRTGAGEFVPPRDPLETQLAALWETLLGKKPVGVRDDFFALGGHSLLAARLFAQIEKLTGKNLPLATLFRAPTVEALAAVLRDTEKAAWSSLVPIRTGGTQLPLFCIHAAGGNVVGYQNLAARLGPEQPVYGLQARGLDGSELPLETVEEMAALYVREIRALKPRGPYHLCGACTGGIVAYEMARQIVAAGEEVGILAMFDTFAHSVLQSLPRKEFRRFRIESTMERVAYHARNLLLEPGRIRYVRRKFRTISRRVNTRLWSIRRGMFERRGEALPPALRKVEEYNMLAIRRYRPGTYPGKITLFPPSDRSVGEYHDPQQGWGSLALGGVEIHHVTGNHLTMLSEPNVEVVAEKLAACLGQWSEEHAGGGGDARAR